MLPRKLHAGLVRVRVTGSVSQSGLRNVLKVKTVHGRQEELAFWVGKKSPLGLCAAEDSARASSPFVQISCHLLRNEYRTHCQPL